MINHTLLGSWLKRFLMEYLISVKNLSTNTQRSYRDTFACCCLSLPFKHEKRLKKAYRRRYYIRRIYFSFWTLSKNVTAV